MMFKPILIAAVVAAPICAMQAPRHTMISFEHILGHVEEIGKQNGQNQNPFSPMRFIQNEIHENLAPMLDHEGMIDRKLATEIVSEIFHRNGFGEMREIITAMILHEDREDNLSPILSDSEDTHDTYHMILTHLPAILRSRGILITDLHETEFSDMPSMMPNTSERPRHPQALAHVPFADQTYMQRPHESLQPRKQHVHKALSADDECSICLEKLVEGNIVCVAPCDDHFHKECIEKWQNSDRSRANDCPNCRQAIAQIKQTPRN